MIRDNSQHVLEIRDNSQHFQEIRDLGVTYGTLKSRDKIQNILIEDIESQCIYTRQK